VTPPVVRRPAARVLCVAGARELLLLLRWRDPASGAEMWEPPGGGVERGEDYEACARRELFEEAGLSPGSLTGPVMVPRDFVWDGARRAGEEAFFLAAWEAVPVVALEDQAGLLGFAWVSVGAVAGLGAVEPPEVAEILSRLRPEPPTPRSR
jgi:8-oxo-dGTP pyrophosphatase MutT (NUDIX family)